MTDNPVNQPTHRIQGLTEWHLFPDHASAVFVVDRGSLSSRSARNGRQVRHAGAHWPHFLAPVSLFTRFAAQKSAEISGRPGTQLATAQKSIHFHLIRTASAEV